MIYIYIYILRIFTQYYLLATAVSVYTHRFILFYAHHNNNVCLPCLRRLIARSCLNLLGFLKPPTPFILTALKILVMLSIPFKSTGYFFFFNLELDNRQILFEALLIVLFLKSTHSYIF